MEPFIIQLTPQTPEERKASKLEYDAECKARYDLYVGNEFTSEILEIISDIRKAYQDNSKHEETASQLDHFEKWLKKVNEKISKMPNPDDLMNSLGEMLGTDVIKGESLHVKICKFCDGCEQIKGSTKRFENYLCEYVYNIKHPAAEYLSHLMSVFFDWIYDRENKFKRLYNIAYYEGMSSKKWLEKIKNRQKSIKNDFVKNYFYDRGYKIVDSLLFIKVKTGEATLEEIAEMNKKLNEEMQFANDQMKNVTDYLSNISTLISLCHGFESLQKKFPEKRINSMKSMFL